MTDETYTMLEDTLQDRIERLRELAAGTDLEEKAMKTVVALGELLTTIDKEVDDCEDRAEKRRIDEERNETMAQVEKDKQKLTSGRVAFEMAKLLLPLGISMIGYSLFQGRVIRFEETGRFTSFASRELHLPSFLKK